MGIVLITFYYFIVLARHHIANEKAPKQFQQSPHRRPPKSQRVLLTTKPSKTQPATVAVVTVTPSKEYIPGSKKPIKDKSDNDDERSMTMIAVISGVAAVGCLVLGFLCLWFIIVQRRKSRYGVKSTLKLWTPSYDGNLTRIKATFSVKSTDV